MDNYYANLIEELNKATEAYDKGAPHMTDREWDVMYYHLIEIEKKQGWAAPNSPTQQVHYNVVNELVKVHHNHFMGSLDKTKSLDELNEFCGNRTAFLSLKLDGLTCSLYYANGCLRRAETRGNGTVGEDITHNALVTPSIPKRIDYLDELVVDGEIICLDKDFIPFSEEYANSRNFAAGSIRLLDSRECAKRNLTFVAWELVNGYENVNSAIDKLQSLRKLGFHVVPFEIIEKEQITEQLVESMKMVAKIDGYPIDGLVVKYDDISFGRSLGATAHHRRDGLAFKFFDESMPTLLQDIEWSMGRTGVLTPIAIFNEIELMGSTVSRASLHNVSVMKELLGYAHKNQPIMIFKANEIIPQVSEAENKEYQGFNYYQDKPIFSIPTQCPICGGDLKLSCEVNTEVLRCENPFCEGKLINKLDHFCGKSGLDIKGLSKATLEKLIDWGWVNCFADIFELRHHYTEWIQKPGFGKASVEKLLDAIEYAQYNSTHESFISAIGIPLIGRTMVKELMKNGIPTYETLYNLVQQGQDFSQFNGFGYEKSESLLRFDYTEANKAYALMTLVAPEPEEKKESTLEGKSIVITGTLKAFKNRAELQRVIEAAGGKVVGSVSKNTSYLINNDIESTSAKNQAAKRLGVPIITEEDFLKII
jgi:DNA ligase (NAD+)